MDKLIPTPKPNVITPSPVLPPPPINRPTPRFVGYIVRFKNNRTFDVPTMAYRLAARHTGGPPRDIFTESIRGFSIGRIPDVAVRWLRLEDAVESVEPDLEVNASVQNVPWSVARVGAAPTTLDGPTIDAHIFVLDTGVQLKHPDLNLVESKSFVRTERSVDDLNGHGTMVAGCAAARNNSTHVVGVAPGAKVHSYKVLDRYGGGSLSNIVSAMDAVIKFRRSSVPDNRIVVNLSLGGYAGTTSYTALDSAIATAVRDYQITVVVAAGNDGADAAWFTPAHTTEALTVGAYDSSNKFASFSNYGSQVDLLAPGKDVLTTGLKSSLVTVSGTSFSAPYTAGAAARYLAENPTALPIQVAASLRTIATEAGSLANPPIVQTPTGTTSMSVYVVGI